MDTGVRDYIDAHGAGFFAALKQWLTIPSISADPDHSGDVRASARWLADHLHQSGFPVAEVWETGTLDVPGLPAVFAEWPTAATGSASSASPSLSAARRLPCWRSWLERAFPKVSHFLIFSPRVHSSNPT